MKMSNIDTQSNLVNISYLNFKKQIFNKYKDTPKFNTKLIVPTRDSIDDLDGFKEKNIDTQNIIQLQSNSIGHLDPDIGHKCSRGFLAVYPNPNVSNNSKLNEINNRVSKIIKLDIYGNHLELSALEIFVLAYYIRVFLFQNKLGEDSIKVYLNKNLHNIYIKYQDKGVLSLNPMIDVTSSTNHIKSILEKTLNYREEYLINEVLLIPIIGMSEAIILNENVLKGYKYNLISLESDRIIENLYHLIFKEIGTHYEKNKLSLNQTLDNLFSDDSDFDITKFQVTKITDLIKQMIEIYLKHDYKINDILNRIFYPLLDIKNLQIIIYFMANCLEYQSHDLHMLFARACASDLENHNFQYLLVKFLVDYSKSCHNLICHNINQDYAFFHACHYGNIKLAKYLYELGGVEINQTFNGSAFNVACINNHIDLAKWIFDLGGVDLHLDNSIGFKLACIRNHIEITEWMWKITSNPEKHFIDWKQKGEFMEDYKKHYDRFHKTPS